MIETNLIYCERNVAGGVTPQGCTETLNRKFPSNISLQIPAMSFYYSDSFAFKVEVGYNKISI